jgi:plastocyanin
MRHAAVCSILLLTLTACPYGGPHRDQSQNSPPKSSTSATNPRVGASETGHANDMNPISPPQNTAQGTQPAPAAGPQTAVELTEFAIHMPQTLNAGPQHFKITNSGKQNHNFVITGTGVSAQLPDNLSRGDSTDITVDLKPGTYVVFCPIDAHRSKGMQTTVTVK